ncbi:MAG TPA: GWxTD domain-containing protein [Bacteroidota bacterium]|nr:GWxTD domain-containing protein [Bacteroidota bacterium]
MFLFFTTLRWHSILAGAFLLLSIAVQAQESDPLPQAQSSFVFFEAIPAFGPDTSLALVHIHYRLKESFFVFVKDPSARNGENFVARGELLVELLDQDKKSVAREVRQIHIPRTALPQPDENLSDIVGVIPFLVPDGRYSILFRVDDRESGRSFLNRDRELSTRHAFPHAFELSFPFLAEIRYSDDQSRPAKIIPKNLGGTAIFGSSGGFALQAQPPSPNLPLTLRWIITRERLPDRQAVNPTALLTIFSETDLILSAFENQPLEGSQFTLLDGYLKPKIERNDFFYEPTDGSTGWKVLFIPLPLEKLIPWPRYKIHLTVVSGTSKKEETYYFGIAWPNRPRSLSDPKTALEALSHIASDSEMTAIQSGSFGNMARAFVNFWRKYDPDTTSVYNEVMEEYYQRVDKAIEKFSSLKNQDGFKTDRGRIMILFGPPSRTNRVLATDNTLLEIWTYDNIGRRFTFADRGRSGNFILVKTEEL